MELRTLQEHIRTLATLAESDSPVLSCYLNLEQDTLRQAVTELEASARRSRVALDPSARPAFDDALSTIFAGLDSRTERGSKGIAVFARSGRLPFLRMLSFKVPLPTWLSVDTVPNIYHLVELKDTYDRYVVVLANEDSARILEVNVGAVTRELWAVRPPLRERTGRGWTREHYQNHRRARRDKFIKEKIQVLDDLLVAEGHTYLILAGNSKAVARFQSKLPHRLAEKIVDVVSASSADRPDDVVAATLTSFVDHEQEESLSTAQLLKSQLRRGELAVAGEALTMGALRNRQVDVLVLADSYGPSPGWLCVECGRPEFTKATPVRCPDCDDDGFRRASMREEMVRLAERGGCEIEIVRESDTLLELGGVGCLLRYLRSEQYPTLEYEEANPDLIALGQGDDRSPE